MRILVVAGLVFGLIVTVPTSIVAQDAGSAAAKDGRSAEAPIVAPDPEKAVSYLEAAISGGDASAMYQLGRMLVRGEDVAVDTKRGMDLLKQASDAGNLNAAIYLGDVLIRGSEGIAADPDAGVAYLEKAGEYRPDAKIKLGEYYLRGLGVPADPKKGEALLQDGIDQGQTHGAVVLGDALVRGFIDGLPADPDRGLALLKSAIDAGDTGAMTKYGGYLLGGTYVPKDETAGIALLKTAAASGDAQAMYVLGAFLTRGGDTVAADTAAGTGYLEQAADAGYTGAMSFLGDALMRGSYGETDVARGTALLQKAIDLGDVRAGFLLARDLLRLDEDKNKTEAMSLLETAADKGSTEAMTLLGETLIADTQSAENVRRGMDLLEKAAEAGDARANYVLGTIYLRGVSYADPDPDRAETYLEASGAGGYSPALRVLGEDLLRGSHLKQDVGRGLDLLRQAADAGDARAAYRIGDTYLQRPELVPTDEAKGLSWLHKAVDGGERDAVALLGEWTLGKNDPATWTDGLNMLRKASDEGSARAASLLGSAYANGSYGLTADMKTAIGYVQKAVDRGDGWSMIRLAGYYLRGEGVKRDPEMAEALYKRALDNYAGYAIIPLSNLYFTGQVGRRDPDKAMATLDAAARAGNVDAIAQLVAYYGDGKWQVTEPNAKKRQFYYELLKQYGSADQLAAEDIVDSLRDTEKMTDYRKASERWMTMPKNLQTTVASRLVKANPNAYVYFIQTLMRQEADYSGPVNGLLVRSTIRAMNALCKDPVTPWGCGNPLSTATASYLVNLL